MECSPEGPTPAETAVALVRVIKRAGTWRLDRPHRPVRHLPDARPGSVVAAIVDYIDTQCLFDMGGSDGVQ